MTAILLPRPCKRYVLIFAIGIASLAGITSIVGCHKAPDADIAANNSGSDPADANMAPVTGTQPQAAAPVQRTGSARVLPARLQNESQQQTEEYPQTGGQDPTYPQQPQPADQGTYDQEYENQVDAGQQALEANEPPPPLPTYQQPEAPGPNYIWTPGYWSYAPVGYYWVPGAWVLAPYPGALWTPGYWAFYGNSYRFYRGYWGPHIGFYGGINYGFGYTGSGYHGGYWNGNNFYYNRAVNRINETRITNVYNRTVVVNNNYNRVSYNGGRGGIPVRPQPAEIAAMRGPRTPPMSAQVQNQRQAAENRQQFYNQNKGRPTIVASPQPLPADHNVHPVASPMPANSAHPNQPDRPQFQTNRPAQQAQPAHQPQIQPARPEQTQVQPVRPAQPAMRPAEPITRPVNPTPQQQPHPVERQPEVRPAPQPQPQVRPTEPQPRAVPETQARPAPQAQPRAVQPPPQQMQRPQPAERPVPQVQQEPRPVQPPQQMQRPQPSERPAPHPSEFHSQPQPQQRPAQQAPHGEPHGDQHPH
jgi:WXXGXW repeat (2 copies)